MHQPFHGQCAEERTERAECRVSSAVLSCCRKKKTEPGRSKERLGVLKEECLWGYFRVSVSVDSVQQVWFARRRIVLRYLQARGAAEKGTWNQDARISNRVTLYSCECCCVFVFVGSTKRVLGWGRTITLRISKDCRVTGKRMRNRDAPWSCRALLFKNICASAPACTFPLACHSPEKSEEP